MTQNLRLVDKTISSSDSDMQSGSFVVPASTSGSRWPGYGLSDKESASKSAVGVYDSGSTLWGAYYTWNAATAGSGVNVSSTGQNAINSICPKGWRMPTGGTSSSSDFNQLAAAYNNNRNGEMLANPGPNFSSKSCFVTGSGDINNIGNCYGEYRSCTLSPYPAGHDMEVYDNGVTPQDNYGEWQYGFSVRCIKK